MVMGWEGYVFALYVSTHINALGGTTKDKNFIICLWVFKLFFYLKPNSNEIDFLITKCINHH